MRNLMTKVLAASIFVAVPLSLPACGGDDEDKPAGGTGGTAGAGGGTGGSSAQGGAGGGTGGVGGGTGGSAGSAGAPSCDLSGDGKPREDLPKQITGAVTLDSSKVYVLDGNHYVTDGATLTIPACTRIEGKQGPPPGTLIVSRGGKLMAVGTKDEPILFTSSQAPGSRAPGDWGGVILLGKATNFEGANVTIEGLTAAPENQYGGTDDADSSGQLSYVRIEFPGYEIGDGNEINGLTMGSVGSGTIIDHVMVSNTLDDGFEWFGGTVSAKYLVMNNAGDDMFDSDQGHRGSLQFLFGRQVVPITDTPYGFEMDSDKAGTKTPGTDLKISNVTLCGTGAAGNFPTFGMLLRERLKGEMMNIINTKFDTGVDVRDDFGTVSAPNVVLTHSLFFESNTAANVIGNPGETDNDLGFVEQTWFENGTGNDTTKPAGFGDCAANPPDVAPADIVPGGTPPAGMDTSATYVGAFKDKNDTWMTGLWIDWAAN